MTRVNFQRFAVFLSALLCACLTSMQARGADIEVFPSDDLNIIVITGRIEKGDEDKFADIAIKAEQGVVFLSSPGGALIPALEIGKLIQIRGFATYVPEDFACVSACALIWVSGEQRYLSARGAVGFHASYRDNDGRLEEAGVANALVGRYLTLLNMSERAIIFATTASPYEVTWLRADDAGSSAIPFEIFDFDTVADNEVDNSSVVASAAAESAELPAPPPIRTLPTERHVAEWYYATEKGGSIWYVRGEDVMRGNSGSTEAEMWVQTDDTQNPDVAYNSSKARYTVNCISGNYRQTYIITFDKDGYVLYENNSYLSSPIVPGTIFEEVTDLVCSDEYPGADSRDLD